MQFTVYTSVIGINPYATLHNIGISYFRSKLVTRMNSGDFRELSGMSYTATLNQSLL